MTEPKAVHLSQPAAEKRPVTLFSATIIVIANMIGTGIFTTLGFQVASVPSPFAVLLLWVVGGVGAFCGALCYGELGAMMPRSGGEYTYLSRIYHPALGFLSAWVSLVAGFAAPIAMAALAFGKYAGALIPGLNTTLAAVALIVLLSCVHLTHVKFGVHFQNLFTLGKILLIAGFIIAGFFAPRPQSLELLPGAADWAAVFSSGFAVSLVYVFFAYSGWNSASYIAGEIRNTEKNLPLALFLGTACVVVGYVLINFVFLYTVPVGELAGKLEVGFLSAQAIFGPNGGALMTALICLALVSSLSSLVMVGPRVMQAMSEDLGILPFLARRSAGGAPAFAVILQSGVALVLTLTATFDAVLTYVGFTLALFASLAVAGVFVLRRRQPDLPRPFKTWGYPVTPAIFLVLYGWMLIYLVVERPLPSLFGLLTLAAGLLLYKLVTVRAPALSGKRS